MPQKIDYTSSHTTFRRELALSQLISRGSPLPASPETNGQNSSCHGIVDEARGLLGCSVVQQKFCLHAVFKSDVHAGHRVALMGTWVRQYGHSFVLGSSGTTLGFGIIRLTARTSRKTTKAMITN